MWRRGRSEMTLIWAPRYAAIMWGTMMFIAQTEWQMTENIIMSTLHHYYHHYNPSSLQHKLRSSPARCAETSPAESTTEWSRARDARWAQRVQRRPIQHLLILGFLSAIPVQCDQLPVSSAEELRGGQSEQEPVPVLPPPEVHGAWDVQRWWVPVSLHSNLVIIKTCIVNGR